MHLRRVGRTVAAALVATVLIVGTPAMASADPGGPPRVYCGGWSEAFGFRFRACLEFRTSFVDHRLDVQYLGSGNVSLYYSGSDYKINTHWGDCTDNWGQSFSTGTTRTYYCTTYRVSGYTYRTRGTIGDDSGIWAYSPTVTG